MLCLAIRLFAKTCVALPASCPAGSWEDQLPTVHIKISCLICRRGKVVLFSVICPVVVTLHKLNIWVKGHELLSLLSV